ncbi:sorting nexin-11 [Trichonephila clavipes]|nr:sorting nexin-11 [Trichonephila clavipes]
MYNNTQMTVVSVHSPLIQFSISGTYYTSYAISLKSNDPCFTHSYSQIRRRYSEFSHLRHRLASLHPTVKTPVLPPKRIFYRFKDAHIEERRNGLQKFLEQVLAIPVYRSDKSLHMFLQSSCSMTKIDEECIGDIPLPQLMDENPSITYFNPDTSSSESTEKKLFEITHDNLKMEDTEPYKVDSNNCASSCSSQDSFEKQTIAVVRKGPSSEPCLIPKRQGSLDSSPCSSPSSFDTGYCSPLEYNRSRRVSFNENVTVAIVYNQLWNIITEPIRTF